MYCSGCGTNIGDGASRCPVCGQQVGKGDSPQPVPAASPETSVLAEAGSNIVGAAPSSAGATVPRYPVYNRSAASPAPEPPQEPSPEPSVGAGGIKSFAGVVSAKAILIACAALAAFIAIVLIVWSGGNSGEENDSSSGASSSSESSQSSSAAQDEAQGTDREAQQDEKQEAQQEGQKKKQDKKAESAHLDINDAYIARIKALQKKYGNPKIKPCVYEGRVYSDGIDAIYGLCCAKLVDFNGDGQSELLTAYNPNPYCEPRGKQKYSSYRYSIWGYDQKEPSGTKRLYDGEAMCGGAQFCIYIAMSKYKGLPVLVDCVGSAIEDTAHLIGANKGSIGTVATFEYGMTSGGRSYVGKNGKSPSGKAAKEWSKLIQSNKYIFLAGYGKKTLKKAANSVKKTLADLEGSKAKASGSKSSGKSSTPGKSSKDAKKPAKVTSKDIKAAHASYYSILKDLERKYGDLDVKAVGKGSDGSKLYNMKGVFFLQLIDFNKDGLEEMVVAYRTGKKNSKKAFNDPICGSAYIREYEVDVYGWKKNKSRRILGYYPQPSGDSYCFILGAYKGKPSIVDSNTDGFAAFTMKGGKFRKAASGEGGVSGKIMVNGKPSSERKFENLQKRILSKCERHYCRNCTESEVGGYRTQMSVIRKELAGNYD